MAGAESGKAVSLWLILAAMLAGALVGLAVRPGGELLGIPVVAVGDFLGTAFLNLLKMLVVPLVVSSVISGVASLGGTHDLGRLGGMAMLFYLTTTLLGVLIGLAVINLFQPGIIAGQPVGALLALHADTGTVAASVREHAGHSVGEVLLGMIPVNVVQAAAEGRLVGLLFFSLLFGVFITRIEGGLRDTLVRFWQATFEVMMRMTGWVMLLAPLGIFGLTLQVTFETGLDAARPLLLFAGCVLAALVVYAFLALPLLLRLTAGVRPWRLFPAMAPALLTALSTASSSATLPLSLTCLQNRAGVSQRVAGFAMPLGTSINHAGSALHVCAAVLFIAQAYGVGLSPASLFLVVMLALVTSMGIAGIPAASVVAITVILAAVGLPPEAVGALLVLDRLLDMARTAVNVLTNSACTVIVARRNGETAVLDPAAPT